MDAILHLLEAFPMFDDFALQSDIHSHAAQDYANQATAGNLKVNQLLKASRLESFNASKAASDYFAFKGIMIGKILPSYWYVHNGVNDYINTTSPDPWEFDRHMHKLDTVIRCAPILPYRINIYSNFI